MALSAEQQAQVDMQVAIDTGRNTVNADNLSKANKLELLRMARDILVENRRTQAAADATDITSSTVTTLAGELESFVNS